jgi:hypothetical protein
VPSASQHLFFFLVFVLGRWWVLILSVTYFTPSYSLCSLVIVGVQSCACLI